MEEGAVDARLMRILRVTDAKDRWRVARGSRTDAIGGD
jgi:hypothetical protein